jgi:hypothetical protein
LPIKFSANDSQTCSEAKKTVKSSTQQKQNSSTEADYKKMMLFPEMCKSLSALNFKKKRKGIIFPKSMKMPFWGFEILTKKMARFI